MERREREGRNLAARTRLATLGKFITLDRFDWNHPRSIDRKLYEHLHTTLDFIERGDNVLLRGPSGVGKTTLAQNLGLAALTRGYSPPSASPASLLCSPICFGANRCPPSNAACATDISRQGS